MPDTSAFPLPTEIAAITAEWLTAALRIRHPGVTVNGVDVVDVVPGTCTKIRLRLDMDAAGKAAGIPELVILKGGFEAHSRAMSHVHLSEVRGYRDLFPVLRLPTPACYFADYDDAGEQGIVIMEDLLTRGVEFCSALRPQNFDQLQRRVSALAAYHAQTWDSPDFAPGRQWDFLPDGEAGLRSYMDQYLLKPEEWQRFVEGPRGAATSVRFHDLDLMIRSFDRLVALSQTLPQCIIHGDTHLGNLFLYADGSPGFVDSLPSRAPGIKEFTYHVVGAMDTYDRRRWEGPLLQHYLSELRGHGITPPSFDEALRQYGSFMLDGHIIFMVNESFYQPESINTAYTARFSAAMIDHDTIGLLA